MGAPRTRILFLCTGNSCRSQMAEGWTRQLWPQRFEAHSAGLEAGGLDPHAVRVMEEAGVDMTGQRSKSVDEFKEAEFDVVITVCDHAREACPVYPGRHLRLHRGFDDPPQRAYAAPSEKMALAHYRRVRDEIRFFVEELPSLIDRANDKDPPR